MLTATRRSLSLGQHAALQKAVDTAMLRCAQALSEMAGVPVAASHTSISIVPLAEVTPSVGNPEDPAVGIYVPMEGEGFGYVLLLLDEPKARELAALMLGEDAYSLVLSEELPASALAEAGNVTCSSFMNAMGEATGLRLNAMPPVVMDDMRGAILDVAIADIAQVGDEALIIETQLGPADSFLGDADVVDARIVALPTPSTLDQILERLQQRGTDHR